MPFAFFGHRRRTVLALFIREIAGRHEENGVEFGERFGHKHSAIFRAFDIETMFGSQQRPNAIDDRRMVFHNFDHVMLEALRSSVDKQALRFGAAANCGADRPRAMAAKLD